MYCSLFRNTRIISNQIYATSRLCHPGVQVMLSTKSPELEIEGLTPAAATKRKTIVPRITLISPNENIQITTLEEAQKLSKRRDLKLVKLVDLDTKTQRPVYKLMTGAEYLAEDLKQREKRKAERANPTGFKGEKVLIMSSSIAEHDLNVHIMKILKWIKKNYAVRVVINGVSSNCEKAESIYKFLAEQIQNQSRIVQKRTKGNDMKFQVLPPKKNDEKDPNQGS